MSKNHDNGVDVEAVLQETDAAERRRINFQQTGILLCFNISSVFLLFTVAAWFGFGVAYCWCYVMLLLREGIRCLLCRLSLRFSGLYSIESCYFAGCSFSVLLVLWNLCGRLSSIFWWCCTGNIKNVSLSPLLAHWVDCVYVQMGTYVLKR